MERKRKQTLAPLPAKQAKAETIPNRGGFLFFHFFRVFVQIFFFSFFNLQLLFFRFFCLQFRFSVSSSVCCSQVPENPFIAFFAVGEGVRVESSGFRISGVESVRVEGLRWFRLKLQLEARHRPELVLHYSP